MSGITLDEDSPDKIVGATDGTEIGNVGDALKVSATMSEGDVTARIIEFFEESGGSSDMLVDGSVTPADFLINPSATKERFINAIRFDIEGHGIKFGNFFSQNSPLTNGVLVTIRSNNSEIDLPLLDTTEDFLDFFSFGPDNFNLFIQAGQDTCRATLTFEVPFQLFKQGTFGTDDFIRVRIQDDLTSGLIDMKALVFGFERDN